MENTDSLQFPDASPRWFFATANEWSGPLTLHEIWLRIRGGQASWADYIWREGQPDWVRACELPELETLAPQRPPEGVVQEILARKPGLPLARFDPSHTPLFGGDLARWFLFYNSNQSGPFRAKEIERFLRVGQITSRVHAWREGLESWMRIEEIAEFKSINQSLGIEKKTKTKPVENRKSPRKPLVARVLMTDGHTVMLGICRDVSRGGLQVLTDQPVGATGARIRLNVAPSEESLIPPFAAEGVVVRLLEDGRGFSFRFEGLSQEAEHAIVQYLAKSQD